MIDRGKILELVSWDKELLAELIQLFRNDVPGFLEKIEKGIEAKDEELVHLAAHRIKGQLRNFFANDMAQVAQYIEEYGNSVNDEMAKEAFKKLKTGIPEVIEALEQLLLDCP